MNKLNSKYPSLLFCSCLSVKYLKMETESAGLYSSLQLSHWFLQCHDPLWWARWEWLLWLVTECEGRRQLQQGCHSARTWNTRTVQRCDKYSWIHEVATHQMTVTFLFLSDTYWHSNNYIFLVIDCYSSIVANSLTFVDHTPTHRYKLAQ